MTKSFTLKELAVLVDGELHGDGGLIIRGLNGIDLVEEGQITFIASRKLIPILLKSKASACIVPKDVTGLELPCPCIRVANPDLASALIHQHFLAVPFKAKGIHSETSIGEGCKIPEEVSIERFVTIGNRVKIGRRVVIHPGVVIGDDSVIGDDTTLYANVTVADHSMIGRRVILHSGVAIGSDGFGYVADSNGVHIKKPQVGNVRIDDDVEIGANSCVDRAAFGTTWIQSGVKIDNLVQIAHNVVIGKDSIIVALTGIAGSAILGKHVLIGGAASIAGHIHLEDGVMVAARAAVHNSQSRGAKLGGVPAFDVRKWAKATAAYQRLPEMIKEIRRLRKEIDNLTAGRNE